VTEITNPIFKILGMKTNLQMKLLSKVMSWVKILIVTSNKMIWDLI